MIQINLLPPELRIQEKKKQIKIPYRKIAIGTFAVFFLFSVYNLYLNLKMRQAKRHYEKQWEALAEKNAEADQLQMELGASILAEIDFYDTFVDPPLEVAHLLNFASDLIPRSIWLSDLKFARKTKEFALELNGYSESKRNDPKLIEIQQFANSLKDQMEQLIAPVLEAALAGGPKGISVKVTTTSREMGPERTEVTQFKAAFQTEGADA